MLQRLRTKLFTEVKKLVPKVSDTELIALRSGTTSLDREIFMGKVKYPAVVETEQKLNRQKVNSFIRHCGKDQRIYPGPQHKKVMSFVARSRFFSFIIDEKYGGVHLSVKELSSVLTRISSANPALGVIVMVPNSLGPAELLQNYGTIDQQTKYLPKLANGDLIPCFGLTGPNNGSDATGSIDEGVVVQDGKGKKYIDVTINKRYITLAPVANLIGVAIRVTDKDNLLEKGQEGVTLALLEKGHHGLCQDTHHNPLDVGFPNGTLKGHLRIPVENVIGGEEQVGHGWKMLMECLAAGRGICLPATAKATSNTAMSGIFEYTRHRKQFNRQLITMEGVQHKMADMLYNTWLIHTSVGLTNNLLDAGEKPAVISAIMKQQTTDRAREVLNHAMDIHAGGAICLGHNNFLAKFYRAAPIGITVEGSNTLTRSLIIFGQGLNKSHPYIYPILESIMDNNEDAFMERMGDIIRHTGSCYTQALCSTIVREDELARQTKQFACLSNFVALHGGSLKAKQILSGDMADILSNLYLAHAVTWYHHHFKVSSVLTKYCVDRLCQENRRIFTRVVDNQHFAFRSLLWFMKSKEKSYAYDQSAKIVDEIADNKKLYEEILEDVQLNDTPLENLIYLNMTTDYNKHYNKMIQVGEYPNEGLDEKTSNVLNGYAH